MSERAREVRARRARARRRVRARRRLVLLVAVAAAVVVTGLVLVGGKARHIIPGVALVPPPAPLSTAVAPGRFAPGACVAFRPTHGDRHLTVFLDAGHGGIDPGAVGRTETGAEVTESVVNLAVELDAAHQLTAQGFRVVVSRTEQTTVIRLGPSTESGGELTVLGSHDDVAARDICANLAHADLLVGIYMDAGATASNAGCVTGYDAARSFAASNLRFARLLQHDVLAAMDAKGWAIPNEGVLPDEDLGSSLTAASVAYGHLLLLGPASPGFFSTPSQMPGALIEPLFLTDPFEGSIAASAGGQRVIAGGVVQAVDQYFPLPPASPTHRPAS